MEHRADSSLRLLEIVASLSLAIDLGMGAPHSWVMRSGILSRHLAQRAGLDPVGQSQALFVTLLRHLGCTSTAEWEARWLGNERAAHSLMPWLMDPTDWQLLSQAGSARAGSGNWAGLTAVTKTLLGASRLSFEDLTSQHCAVAQRVALQWNLGAEVEAALGQSYERWDGGGQPVGLESHAVAPTARLAALALDIVRFSDWGGLDAATHVVRRRRGTFYDPELADLFLSAPQSFQPWLDQDGSTSDLLAAEPSPHRYVEPAALDACLSTLAEFADAQTSDRFRWSERLSDLVGRAALLCLSDEDALLTRRAALVQGLGRLTVESSVWSQSRALRPAETERVRLVPYHTERILAVSSVLAPLGTIAAQSFERLDGSGYPRGLRGSGLSRPARLLAAATVYQALVTDRPYRKALPADQVRTTLNSLAAGGKLDPDSVAAILGAAEGLARRAKVVLPFELTPRELDVLKGISRGLSNKQMAVTLRLSPRTVDHHIERLYAKIHVRRRAEATQFALKNSLSEFQ